MSENSKKKTSGPEISKSVFGGVLDYDGAGRYPGLELLNLVFCGEEDYLPAGDKIKITRRGHDFARRLVWDEDFADNPSLENVLYDGQSTVAIQHLLKCIQLPIPSTNKIPSWHRAHFFPYTKSLIHWDARLRGRTGQTDKKPQLERLYLRGGGALAFKVLRKDKNADRLERICKGLEALYSTENSSALEKLANVLLSHGQNDELPVVDSIEAESRVLDDKYDELLRDGVANILGHAELPSVARIKALINWTGFWLIMMQHSRASLSLGNSPGFIVCDCGAAHPQLRRESQRCFTNLQSTILESVDVASLGMELNRKQRDKMRGFFWATAATIGLLNAWRGRRHFTLGIEALEMHVLAAVEPGVEMSFEQFTSDWLFGRCGIVTGRDAAQQSGLLEDFDASIFEDNEDQLSLQMQAAGLLSIYSDATRMVNTGQGG